MQRKYLNILSLFIFIFSFFNQIKANPPFTYQYKTEIFTSSLQNSFELKPEIEDFAKELNSGLNHTVFFDTKFVRQPKKVREYYKKNFIGKI